jgi:CO/xanthine dehydrogenase FAD-binding subunit
MNVQGNYPALAEALLKAPGPQIRNMSNGGREPVPASALLVLPQWIWLGA